MIAFASRTGNIRFIIEQLNLPNVEISNDLIMNIPYFLFTYTDGLGDTPEKVSNFLSYSDNRKLLRGVIVSGNINFGESFCKPANDISKAFSVPIIRKIDLRGSESDLEAIKKHYYNILR